MPVETIAFAMRVTHISTQSAHVLFPFLIPTFLLMEPVSGKVESSATASKICYRGISMLLTDITDN